MMSILRRERSGRSPLNASTLNLATLLVGGATSAPRAQQQACAFVTAASGLEEKLRCTSANVQRVTLSSTLLPIADNVSVSGTVEADPTLNLFPFTNAKPVGVLACHEVDDFTIVNFQDTHCMGLNNDGDITFSLL